MTMIIVIHRKSFGSCKTRPAGHHASVATSENFINVSIMKPVMGHQPMNESALMFGSVAHCIHYSSLHHGDVITGGWLYTEKLLQVEHVNGFSYSKVSFMSYVSET